MASAVGPVGKVCDPDMGTGETFRRQGSQRKVLPSFPNVDSQMSMSAKMIDRPTSSNKKNQMFGRFSQEYILISEYNLLEKQKLPGIFVIPSAHSPLLWFGVLFIRNGLYQGGVFRFSINIPENFPDTECPKVVFETPVYHPMIHPGTGELDIRRGFQEWRKNVNHIWQVLLYMRRAFYKIELSSPWNAEAVELYRNKPEEFRLKVMSCVMFSNDHVYDPPPTSDPHYLCFEPYNTAVHGLVRGSMFSSKVNEESGSSSAGLSWVQPGSLQTFSKGTS